MLDAVINSTDELNKLPIWHSPYHPIVQALIWIVAALLSLETVIGNAMVIIAWKIDRSISKQASNRYIVSLALSDLIIGIEGIPLFTVYVVNGDRWPLGSIACNTWLFLDYTLCLVSILTVLLITTDRYLSVCKTAQYLKWQSTMKTEILIVLSWVISATIFGVMIYFWPLISGDTNERPDDECYAPFLANPYVNMAMYIIYYWSTLVAMLILYQGIHKAAKNLEKKAKAKEHRHIALLLTQRLGTQVGVSLMLQSERANSLRHDTKDSGYHTNNLSNNVNEYPEALTANQGKMPPRPSTTIRREPLSLKRSFSPGFSFRKRAKRLSMRSSVRSVKSIPTAKISETSTTSVALKPAMLLKKEDSVAAIKFTSTILESPPDPTRSDTTSVILSRRLSHKSTHTLSLTSMPKTEEWKSMENVVPIATAEAADTPLENGCQKENHLNITRPAKTNGRWFGSFRFQVAKFRRRSRKKQSSVRHDNRKSLQSRSMSTSSSDSSDVESPKRAPKKPLPMVTVTREAKNQSAQSPQSPDRSSEPFLGSSGVTRKISNISSFTKDTSERVISSLFSPIAALNRGRKRTKAERRAHKAFRTITFIVGLFAILWSPYYVVATIYGFCKGECIPSLLYNLSYYMCYLNSSGNPFAYALANRQFRTAFLRMFHGNFRRVM
ncbi:putative muscarinic acetylcholine receptor gar-1 [Aphelenchoides besseyi]|nr:putative muscarinic acetylcholine receptor gar-1 [Aphelenchoides besseyi]KAI6200845.1 putative muscarinic acetylcholine receptor gar-1 [Aphelenchoides besseyi]